MADVQEILAKYGSSDAELEAQVEDTEVPGTLETPEEEIDDSTDSQPEEPKEKMLPQSKVDKIVKERLERERGKFGDYEDLKEIAESLKQYGYQGTVKEIREQLKQAVDAAKTQEELDALEKEAEEEGTSPALLKKIKDLEKKLGDIDKEKKEAEEKKQKEAEEKAAIDAEFDRQTKEFVSKFPDVDLMTLANDPKFNKFAKASNPDLTVSEIYENYVELIGETEAAAIAKMTSKKNRSTSSGRNNSSATGGTYGLTPNQQQLARENGMTNKQYADSLAKIRR